MNKARSFRIAGVAAIALSASLAAGLPAQAAGNPADSTRGTCTGDSHVKLSVNNGKGDKLKVKAMLTRGDRGDRIEYVLADNGNKVKIGNKDTGKQGKTTIRLNIPNVEGTDSVLFTSTNTDTLEICTALVVFDD
jgi:hypothetical protein